MQTEKLLAVASCLTMLGLLVAGCAPAADPAIPKPGVATEPAAKPAPSLQAKPGTPTPSPKQATEQPRYGGILNIASTTDPPSLDVQQETLDQTLLTMEADYSGLLQYDPLENDKVVGDLAERWEVSPDGTSYTFHLHQNVKWHDGQPLTAEDVRFSLDRMREPPKGVRSAMDTLLTPIKQIETPDKDTVKIVLNHPSPSTISFLGLGQMVIYPKHVIEARGDMKKSAVGTGPYKLKAYNAGVSIEHVKNTDYFVKGRPYLDGITFYLIRDRGARFAAFRTKRLHLSTSRAGPTVAEAEHLRKNYPEALVEPYPTLRRYEVRPLVTKPPFNDERVRKAIHLVIDRQLAIKVVGQGEGWIGGPLPPYGDFAISEEELLKLPGYRQPKDADIAEAKRLMAEAGHPQGFKTQILGRPESDQEFVIFLKSQLATIGIDAEIRLLDTSIVNQLRAQKAFDILSITYGLKTLDPEDNSRYFLKGAAQNFNDFYDEKVEALFGKQKRTVDLAERKKIALELQFRLLEIAGAIVGFWERQRASYWPEIKNYRVGLGTANLNKYQDVWLAK